MPISFAVGVSTVFATLLLPGVDNATIVQRMLTAINTFPLLAVIFFVFAGTLMARGGLQGELVLMAEVLVGWLPGSLAQIVCVASMFFGGVTGSAVAEVSSIGAMMIPAMDKDGYSRRFATAIVLTAATMGPIIRPSIGMIVYAHVAGNVSIAALFLAGVIPGVMIGLSLMIASFIHGKLYHQKTLPKLTPRKEVAPHHRRRRRRVHDGDHPRRHHLRRLHRHRSRRRRRGLRDDPDDLSSTRKSKSETSRHHLGMLRDQLSGHAPDRDLLSLCVILTYENLPNTLADDFFNLIQSKWAFLLTLNIFLLVVGMFVDIDAGADHARADAAATGRKFDINLVHLGLIVVIDLAFDSRPPVGTALFLALKVGRFSMEKIIPPLLPLLACMCVVLIFVTYVPEVYMWLPRSFGLVK